MFVIDYKSLNQVFKFISLKHLIFKKAILLGIFTSVEPSFLHPNERFYLVVQ
jgi:hypothetical protein